MLNISITIEKIKYIKLIVGTFLNNTLSNS